MHGVFPPSPASPPNRLTAQAEVRARDATVVGVEAAPGTRTTGTLPRLLPPGWPLSALFLGFPLWWALGLGTFAFILFAIPMAVDVLSRRGLRAPRGFGCWLVFLVWMIAGAALLWSDAPGAEPGGGGAGRLTVYGYRLAMYLASTAVLLYVVNARERDVPTTRVLRLLAFMFVVTTCGGLLGVVAPTFEFRSALEILLPHGLASNEFVRQMIHPAAADVQDFLGYAEARPIAPFPFANSWGANFSLYLPFFLLAWFGRGAGWRRWVAPFILLAGVVPTVYSLNRGLWLALGVGACYLAARLALLGRYWAVNLIGVALLMGAVAFLASPLGSLVEQRIETPHSNERRADLAT
ncbi:MAG TPA: hypothetical protein VE287_11730, partial [Actinopolymorphaceae bacterium]|nr:hypothetical protein [Actinopolymorphaceae bacterium]